VSLDPTLQIFFDEATDLLASFEEGVLGLEARPDDAELLNSVFRAAHTLKGNSSMLGFVRVASFTHVLEELLTRLRAGTVAPGAAIVTTLLSATDVLKELVAQVRDNREAPIAGLEELTAVLEAQARGETVSMEAVLARPSEPAPPAPGTRTLYEIRFTPRGEALRRGLNPTAMLEALGTLGEILRVDPTPEALPPLERVDPQATYTAFTCWLMSIAGRAEIDACFEFADEPGAVHIDGLEMDDPAPRPALAAAPRAAEAADGSALTSPRGFALSAVPGGEAAPPVAAAPPAGGILRSPQGFAISDAASEPAAPASPSAESDRRQGDRRQSDRRQWDRRQQDSVVSARTTDVDSQSIRVGTDKVDRLVNLVGELLITQSMVTQLVDGFQPSCLPQLREAVAQMDRHSRELQERVMAVRMLPIKTVFGRFARVVRDLAQSLGKQVQFETVGEDTELDKTVIERIGDPLTHLVRNSVDHGIEAPEVRAASGKPEAGRLRLSAYQQGGSIYIEIEDDGRGLDRQRILTKAIEQGLVSPSETLSDDQVWSLIFRPGFSTAQQVTAVSGRGVGMDVVRRNVEALGGNIAITTVPGQGTTLRIKLPLTLAILDGQLLKVGDQVYVIPLIAITESVRPSREHLATVLGRGETFALRGQVVPMVRIHRLFGVREAVEDPTRAILVVVETDGRRAALQVDDLLGQQQVVIKSLDTNFDRVDGLSGATILGDGRVALILDVPGLVALASRASTIGQAA
jgi:two-component system chemotaxis sensor kinase CheA